MSATLKAVEATVGIDGEVKLDEALRLNHPARAIVTLLIDEEAGSESETAETDEDRFHRRLAEIGLLQLPVRSAVPLDDEDDEPIEVSGPPLSETIIQDRG